MCEKSYGEKHNLLRHQRTKHGNQSRECPICHLQVNRTDSYTRHVRQQQRCPDCGIVCCTQNAFKKHQNTHNLWENIDDDILIEALNQTEQKNDIDIEIDDTETEKLMDTAIRPFWDPTPEGFLYTPQETPKKKKVQKKLYKNYVDYAILRLSNKLYIKVKKSMDTDNVRFILERKNIFGKIVDTLSFYRFTNYRIFP